MPNMKDIVAVPKPRATRIWVCWEDDAWSEFDLAGRLVRTYPPLPSGLDVAAWAVSGAKVRRREPDR
ncbi:hypothetical protein ACFL6X_06980 [Candidatus Latescibacterota bacterium]